MEKFYTDIMAGIALEEAGIAHILNAEGEKIQLAVANCSNICELLEVNASVACTIEEIMWLEFISYHKMKTLLGCCSCQNCKEEKPPRKKPCCDEKKKCPPKAPCKKCGGGETGDCLPIKEKPNCSCRVEICGRVFKANGEIATCGVVTANGNGVVSTEICSDGRYFLKNLNPTTKLVVNAHSNCGKTGSFLLKKPFKNSYQIDMFLDG
ncbi:MAG: hypothetical protein R3Y45_07215 [Bacillota bacterium]